MGIKIKAIIYGILRTENCAEVESNKEWHREEMETV